MASTPADIFTSHYDYYRPSTTAEPVADDPWAHRSKGMRCKTCMWFVEKTVSTNSRQLGRCRRHAPTMSGFPAAFTDDWCGDHKLDESKII